MKTTGLLKITMFLLFLLCFAEGYAKDKKLKLSKNIVYVGEVLDKQPYGKGQIKCLDPEDKENPTVTIEGRFNRGKITNAELHTKGFDGFAVLGDFDYFIETDNDKNQFLYVHTVYASKVYYSHNSISQNSSSPAFMKINGIDVSFRFDKKAESWDYQLIDKSNATQESITQIVEFANKCPEGLYPFGYNDSNLSKSLCPITISKGGLVLSGGITYKFNNSDEYSNGTLTINQKGVFNIKSDTEWNGYREFTDVVVKKKTNDQNTVTIEYKNGDLFEGVINSGMDIRAILGYNANSANIQPWEGTGKVNGKPEKWVKGETLTNKHKRLSVFLDEDLVLEVENGSITEDQGKNEMKRRKEESAYQKTLATMRKYWGNNKVVVFMGDVTLSEKNNQVLSSFMGFDRTYIGGKAILYLDDSNRGRFLMLPTPTAKAYSAGRGTALQIYTFCNDYATLKYKGIWEIENGIIYVDGKECGGISSDGTTVTHNGMLISKMKLHDKTTESSVGNEIPEIDEHFK